MSARLSLKPEAPSTAALKQRVAARPSSSARASFRVMAAKKGTKPVSVKSKVKDNSGKKGIVRTLLETRLGKEPEWIDPDTDKALVKKMGTKVVAKETIYIGKVKNVYQGNIGEPRTITDVPTKYPGKEAYGPFGIFDNASGGWAGGEAGLKLMFLSTQTEKMKPGTKINVRRNMDIRSTMYSGLKGTVKSVDVGVNEVFVELLLDEPAEWWELAVQVTTGVLCLGAVGFNFTVLNSITSSPDPAAFGGFVVADLAAFATIYLAFYTQFMRRRTNGKPVSVPVESCFIPGVDKVPDPFWDAN